MKVLRTSYKWPKRRARYVRRDLPAMEWLEDISGKCARATVIGNRRLLIENHTGIIEFSSECIRLNSGGGPLLITGQSLVLCNVRQGALIVQGEIHRVELPCEGSDAHEG